jgi:DNA invertase Pin-like site-specific DNA recombinase
VRLSGPGLLASGAACANGGDRLSGSGQQRWSAGLEAQRRALAAACRRCGWRLVEAVEQAGFSAEDLQRAGVREARRLLELDPGETLVAAKPGRLCRSLADLTLLLASAQQQGWALVALDCVPELTGPAGEAAATLLVGFAPFERRLISQRTRAALADRRAQGHRLGRPPTMSAYAIDRIRRERAAGTSLTAIANGLNADGIPTAQGGRRWYPATVRHTLNRTP